MSRSTGIVHQLDPLHPVPGGIDSVIGGIVRYAPADISLVIVGADRSGDRSRRLGALERISVDGREIGFLPVARLGAGGRAGRVPETLKLALGLIRHRRAVRAAVAELQVHRSETGLVASCLFRRTPRIQCIHGDSDRALRERTGSYWRFLRRLHLWLEQRSVRSARWTYVFSRSGAARLARAHDGVSYLPTWYDPARVRTRVAASSGSQQALWVGRFEEEKDPLLALATMERFVAARPDRRARMLGAGTLLDTARQASRSDRIELPGSVSTDDVAEAMADSDVLLMTSRFEGSPVVMSEALAAGTPVVATAASDPDERIEDGRNGSGGVERTPDALTIAMVSALALDRAVCADSVRDLAAPEIVPKLFESS